MSQHQLKLKALIQISMKTQQLIPSIHLKAQLFD